MTIQMMLLYVGIPIILSGLMALIAHLRAGADESETFPYARAGALFTSAERDWLGVLDQAIGARYRVFGKVRIADVLVMKDGSDTLARKIALDRIKADHFDFVLCEPADLSIVCAIELDDGSDPAINRWERDWFVVGACAAAQLPLARFHAKKAYTLDDLRQGIDAVVPASTTKSVPRRSPLSGAPLQLSEVESPSFSKPPGTR